MHAADRSSSTERRIVAAPRSRRARAPRPARPASPARSGRRRRRSSRARRDRAVRMSDSWMTHAAMRPPRRSASQLAAILDARRRLDAGRHIDAVRLHLRDRLARRFGVQSAREDDRAAARDRRPRTVQSIVRPVPPRRIGSCASSSTRHARRQRPTVAAARTRRHRHGLDRPVVAPRGKAAGDLVAVQLHGAERHERPRRRSRASTG